MLMYIPFSVLVLAISFVLIALRNVANIKLQIWQIVTGGAIAVLLASQITFAAALSYIDPTVIVFLIGIFIVGDALTESGYMQYVAYRIFGYAKSVDSLVLLVMLVMGIGSMVLLNDTLAVIGTPVVLLFASQEKIDPKLMLLALAFSITIGSVASPIGNPQNILIASSGLVSNQFITFPVYLLVPTLINIALAYAVLRVLYRKEFRRGREVRVAVDVKDIKLARLCKISIAILVLGIAAYTLLEASGWKGVMNFAYIAPAAAMPILIFSDKRRKIAAGIDWSTIVFFISMFVLVGAVWQSGFAQMLVGNLGYGVGSVPVILLVNVVGSQFISNVPMVMLYLKLLAYKSVPAVAAMALAAGSTVAGNLFILGAASNIIIVTKAEKKYGHTISFWDFTRAGIIITAMNIAVYWLFLSA